MFRACFSTLFCPLLVYNLEKKPYPSHAAKLKTKQTNPFHFLSVLIHRSQGNNGGDQWWVADFFQACPVSPICPGLFGKETEHKKEDK